MIPSGFAAEKLGPCEPVFSTMRSTANGGPFHARIISNGSPRAIAS